MNRIKTKIGLIGLAAMTLVTSCIPDPPVSDSIGTLTSVGNILRHDGNDNFDIVIDNYDTLKTSNTSTINPEQTPAGTRVSFEAKIYEKTDGKPIVYKGDLKKISVIPIYEPLLLSEVQNDESLGEDLIDVLQLTFSDKYINTTYRIRQNDISIKHKISYVIDDVNLVDQGVLNIKMRHNMNGDVPAQEAVYMTSCNIEKYIQAAPNGELKINLYYDNSQGVDRVRTVTWKKDWWK